MRAPPDSPDDVELARYVPSSQPEDIEAVRWLLRERAGMDDASLRDHEAWLCAAPRNRLAYERQRLTWDDVSALPDQRLKALRSRSSRPPSTLAPAWRPPRRTLRWAAFASICVLATCGWQVWRYWMAQPLSVHTYATTRGELRDVLLADGSRLQLDTATRAEVTMYRTRREVRLSQGQAMFTVTHVEGRPFDVLAGSTRVTVVGTRFDVKLEPTLPSPTVSVAVEQGRVRVSELLGSIEAEPRPEVVLGAGESVSRDAQGRLGAVAMIAPAAVAPWREGRVSFDNVPLSQVLAEFERYGDTRLRVADASVGALRLTGSFDVRRIDAFSSTLVKALPVRLDNRAGTLVISRAGER